MRPSAIGETVDLRKAAVWALIAAAAHAGNVAAGDLAYPYLRNALIAVAFPLMLPAIAVLHPLHAAARPSGAVLATALGTAAVVAGLGASVNVDLQPAALLVLGMWWWTTGKMWAQTGVMPAATGVATAVLGAVAVAASLLSAFAVAAVVIRYDLPYVDLWRIAGIVIAVWLALVAFHLIGMARHTMGR